MARQNGPVVIKLRVRSSAGGAGKIEWLPKGAGDPSIVKSVPFAVRAGDWQELSVDVAEEGPLGTMRLYLPVTGKPVDLDWIEMSGKTAKSKPQRWDFKAGK